MARAYSVTKILSTKYELVQWGEAWATAFGYPAASGVWFIWGNSGNAKTRFMLELAKELSKTKRVFYNSREEGNSHTMQLALIEAGIDGSNRKLIIGNESADDMRLRLAKRRGPEVVIMDSIQYFTIRFAAFREMVESNPDVLFIVNSQADGKQPLGNVAKSIRFDAALKIWVEGYVATSNGRYNPGGQYTIWAEGAERYYGQELKKDGHENT